MGVVGFCVLDEEVEKTARICRSALISLSAHVKLCRDRTPPLQNQKAAKQTEPNAKLDRLKGSEII